MIYCIKGDSIGNGSKSIIGGTDFKGTLEEAMEIVNSNKPKKTYIELRAEAYGSPAEQLEFITEFGLTAWKAKVKEIKEQYPKEEV